MLALRRERLFKKVLTANWSSSCSCCSRHRPVASLLKEQRRFGSSVGSSSGSEGKEDTQRAAEKRFASTLFLPKTAFDIRANAAAREPLFRPRTTSALYHWQQKHNQNGSDFILHDGPPYANGSLHTGHAMNKILKDIINRFQVLLGNRVHYVPGWDCHGLPIELKATQSLQSDANKMASRGVEDRVGHIDTDALELRKTAANFALRTIETQKEEFSHFGIMADWSRAHTYRTLDPEYEANQLQVFGQMARAGLIYRQYRPVYWSPSSKTALAEAELEYNEAHRSRSVYVRFKLDERSAALRQVLEGLNCIDQGVDLVVWTTTPWTLPANAAVAIHKDLEYVLVRLATCGSATPLLIIGKDRLEAISSLGLGRVPAKGQDRPSIGKFDILASFNGSVMLDSTYRHPFLASASSSRPIVPADFVTATAGTGLVHCAPAHGADDYGLLRNIGMIDREGLFSPVDDDGKFTAEVGNDRLVGLDVVGAGSKEVINILEDADALLSEVPIVHKYPYDWRTKKPVITRATSQWFANLDRIKQPALKALEAVQFFPPTGRNRLEAFIRSRSEWCISRQRAWGVPLPVLYDTETDEALVDDTNVRHIAKVLKERGTNHWWEGPVDDFIAPEHKTSGRTWRKGRDTVDVWFDSGVSWTLLRGLRPKLPWADIYLEGSDQHRGWFQSSLLTAIAVGDQFSTDSLLNRSAPSSSASAPAAPFKQIVTHGFVVDEKGKKMSKSIGNVLSPLTIVLGDQKKGWPAYGTDVLRFWVAKSDYSGDVPVGPTVVKKAAEAVRKVRNVARFMLANLPAQGALSSSWSDMDRSSSGFTLEVANMSMADRYILLELYRLERACRKAYDVYDFAQVMRRISEFASGPLSSLYLDITKDVLYADPQDSQRRQTVVAVLDQTLRTFTSILAPVTPHLAEEIFHFYRGSEVDPAPDHQGRSVFECRWQSVEERWNDEDFEREMAQVLEVRDAVLASLETARRDGHVKSSLAAGVEFSGPTDSTLLKLLRNKKEELPNLFLVSDVSIYDEDEERPAPADNTWSLPSRFGDVTVRLRSALAHKCPRCWTWRRQEHEEVCGRCTQALAKDA